MVLTMGSTINYDFYKRLIELSHRNLAKVHNVFMADGEVYVIEDYINGQTLKTVLEQEGVLPKTKILDYVLQICEALSYLHGQNPPIIHRDVKPANVICSTDNIIKLVDFDIAREFKKTLNRDTVSMGTKEYAAPEQYGFKQTDCRTDIYTVGVLIHELATGKLPLNNITYNGKFRKVIDKCLQLDPEKRFQNVLALKNALDYRYFTNKKSFATLAIISFVCFGCWAIYTSTNTGKRDILGHPEDSAMIQTSTDDGLESASADTSELYDLFVRIVSEEDKPSILLENAAVTQMIKNITGSFFNDVVGTIQEYMFWNSEFSYYDPADDSIILPVYKFKDGYAHDRLMLEMSSQYMSILYYSYDGEMNYYFTTLDDKGRLTPDIFQWAQSHPIMYENPIVFQERELSKDDITGIYWFDKKKIEIFEDGGVMKFSFTDTGRSPDANPRIIETIYELGNNHYWIRNFTSGDKNRLIFNFSKNHLTLLSELYEEMIYFQGIYDKE